MGNLHLIGGEKGGVGKSFTARLLAQYLIDSKQPFVGFDSDKSHATFSRFYSEFTSAVSTKELESLDEIIETAEQHPEFNIILDLAAQTSEQINVWMDSCELTELMDELNYKTYIWHVMDDSADALNLLQKTLAQFRNKNVQLVVVQNYGRGNSFKNFEQSPTYRLAKEQGAKMVLLARLHENLTQKIDFGNLSFWAAAHSKQNMKIAERQRVKVWLKHSYAQLDKLFENEAGASQSNDNQQAPSAIAQQQNNLDSQNQAAQEQNQQAQASELSIETLPNDSLQAAEPQAQMAQHMQPLHAIREALLASEKRFR